MKTFVKLYSNYENEIYNFLSSFYGNFFDNTKIFVNKKSLEWEKIYDNPIELTDIIGAFIENNDKYKINMWISLDKDVLINVTNQNAEELIRYLFERYPY